MNSTGQFWVEVHHEFEESHASPRAKVEEVGLVIDEERISLACRRVRYPWKLLERIDPSERSDSGLGEDDDLRRRRK